MVFMAHNFVIKYILATTVAQWLWCLAADPKDADFILAVAVPFDGGRILEARVLCNVSAH